MNNEEYLCEILCSIRMDFNSKWKVWLEKRLAIYVCNQIIENAEDDSESIFYENILDEIILFNIFKDGRNVRDIYQKIMDRESEKQ